MHNKRRYFTERIFLNLLLPLQSINVRFILGKVAEVASCRTHLLLQVVWAVWQNKSFLEVEEERIKLPIKIGEGPQKAALSYSLIPVSTIGNLVHVIRGEGRLQSPLFLTRSNSFGGLRGAGTEIIGYCGVLFNIQPTCHYGLHSPARKLQSSFSPEEALGFGSFPLKVGSYCVGWGRVIELDRGQTSTLCQ